MCCLYPAFHYLKSHVGPEHDIICMLIATETIRWVFMGIPIFLSVWQYTTHVPMPVFIPNVDVSVQFWLVTSLIFVGVSLFVYIPTKIAVAQYWKNARRHGWRPSIIMYIICCALPCLIIITIATNEAKKIDSAAPMNPTTTAVLQAIVMGLTVTEWMAKMREEVLTFDLTSSMATDFFFAYDVIAFFMLPTVEDQIYHSAWFYATVGLGFVAMFKYVPNQPLSMADQFASPSRAVVCILVSMLCTDLPFLVVRTATMAQYGMKVSDVIHPTKNVAMILFGLTQLYIIQQNWRATTNNPTCGARFSERRLVRDSCVTAWKEAARKSVRARRGSGPEGRHHGAVTPPARSQVSPEVVTASGGVTATERY